MARYTELYREAADARSLFVLLDGEVEHSAAGGRVPSGQRVQRCDGVAVGATGAWSKSMVVVGLEALSRVPRDTTATTLKECVLLRLGSHVLSPDAVVRELVQPPAPSPSGHPNPYPSPTPNPNPNPNPTPNPNPKRSHSRPQPKPTPRARQVRQQLPDVPLFFGLSAEALEQVAALSSAIEVEAGQDVLEVVPYHFCILTHGSASVVLKDSGLCVAYLHARPADPNCRNPFFGEMSLLHNQEAVAHVRATSAVRCITISSANFARFLDTVPDFEERVSEISRARRRENDLKLKLEAAEAERAEMLATDKATAVLALPQMQLRERRIADDDLKSGLAREANSVLFTQKMKARVRRPPKGTTL